MAGPSPSRRRSRLRLAGGALALLATAGACARAVDHVIASAVSEPADAVRAARVAEPMAHDAQTLMTRRQPARPGDAERAARLARETRLAIARFRDTSAALAAGYRSFPAHPPPTMRIVHYVHNRRAAKEKRRLDTSAPGNLLYERGADGTLRLVGAMFTAPVDATPEELDRRVPLSVTQWHLHQNVCVPKPVWSREAWARTAPSGRPLFGPGSAITTREGCAEAGGRFLPTVFGWMVHVHPFAPDSADLWNAMYGHGARGAGGHEH